MTNITQARINTVTKAGNHLIKRAELQTSQFEENNHLAIGQFMLDHPEKVLKLIIKTNKRK